MNNKDKKNFLNLINSVSELLGLPFLTEKSLFIFFNILNKYSFDQVENAFNVYLMNKKNFKMIRPAEILEILEGKEFSVSEIIALARLKNTPFGVLTALYIGNRNLEFPPNSFYLNEKANEIIFNLDYFKDKFIKGNLSLQEIKAFIKYDVDIFAPFVKNGVCPPFSQELKNRYDKEVRLLAEEKKDIKEEKIFTDKEIEKNKKRIKEIIKEITK